MRVLFFWRWILCGESRFNTFPEPRGSCGACRWCSSSDRFCAFDRENYLTLAASLIGVTSLIFNAKGNPIGQVLMVLFSLLYGIISYTFAYYGEMITYLGMTMPMAVFALISWLKNPYNGRRSEVKVNTIGKKEIVLMCLAAVVATGGVLLDIEDVPHGQPPSQYPLRYHQLSGGVSDLPQKCLFCAGLCQQRYRADRTVGAGQPCRHPVSLGGRLLRGFLVNDLYGFINWRRMKERQRA